MSESHKTPEAIVSRHSFKEDAKKPGPNGENLGSDYIGISKKGVEVSRDTAKDILEMIKNEPEGTIFFLAGASDMARTKSTSEIYTEEIDKILKDQGDSEIMVITRGDVKNISNTENEKGEKPGYRQIGKMVSEQINSNPDKKVVLDLPLYMKEFGFGGTWTNKDGSYTDYLLELMKKNNNNTEECVKDWIENEGKIGDLVGPNPTELAKEQIEGIKRLADFARGFVGNDRKIVVGVVGHSWTLDALAVYLANDGKVNMEGFNKVGGQMIKENQLMQISKNENGEPTLYYNDQEYIIDDIK